jgi:hypothetical protein
VFANVTVQAASHPTNYVVHVIGITSPGGNRGRRWMHFVAVVLIDTVVSYSVDISRGTLIMSLVFIIERCIDIPYRDCL